MTHQVKGCELIAAVVEVYGDKGLDGLNSLLQGVQA